MQSRIVTQAQRIDPKAHAELIELVRRNYPDAHPFRIEVEAISATESRFALLERLPTLIRLLRRSGR